MCRRCLALQNSVVQHRNAATNILPCLCYFITQTPLCLVLCAPLQQSSDPESAPYPVLPCYPPPANVGYLESRRPLLQYTAALQGAGGSGPPSGHRRSAGDMGQSPVKRSPGHGGPPSALALCIAETQPQTPNIMSAGRNKDTTCVANSCRRPAPRAPRQDAVVCHSQKRCSL